ncbi:MAG: exodeoxyribonuclease VII small subunit [Granulosicoccus sp.]|jgi:exodeoxyribonuclease VII small subunit
MTVNRAHIMTNTEQNDVQSTATALSFEDSIGELETLVTALENGELSLEESLDTFEKGIRLTKACQQQLTKAEQKIALLTTSGESVAFDGDTN